MLGILPDTYLVPVSHIMGLGVRHIDAIWIHVEFVYGTERSRWFDNIHSISHEDIHYSIHHITVHGRTTIWSPFISTYSLWRKLTTISFININNIIKYSIIIINNLNNSSLNITITILALIYTSYDTTWRLAMNIQCMRYYPIKKNNIAHCGNIKQYDIMIMTAEFQEI